MKPVPAGSRLTISTAGGGGYGPPWERELEAVAADVRAGYVSQEQAREVYGVQFQTADGRLDVDESATAELRTVLAARGHE